MRYVSRPEAPPGALSAPGFQKMRQEFLEYLHLDPLRRAQTRVPSRKLPQSASLIAALSQAFSKRCAFCESPHASLRPYRFRPPEHAYPVYDDKMEELFSYGWLADIWQNIYPICPGCVPSDPYFFPILAKDGAPKERMPHPSIEEYMRIAMENTGGLEDGPR